MSETAGAKVLIVIPTLNEIAHLAMLLDSVIVEARELAARIIVVDGGSTDGTVEVGARYEAQFDCVTLIHNRRKIQSAAVNLAVQSFGQDADYLIRIDAHGEYPADYCRSLVHEAERMHADSVVVPMTTVGRQTFQRAVATAQNSLVGTGGSSHRTGKGGKWVEHGHHALMAVPAFRAVGGYDESFRHNEDAELDYRLGKTGSRIWLTDVTGMIYYPRTTPQALFRQYMGYGSGRARNIMKHRVVPRVRQVVPLVVMPTIGLAGLSLVHWAAIIPLAGWSLACLSLGAVAAAQHEREYGLPVALAPLVGLAAMIMHLAWSYGFWRQVVATGIGQRGQVR